MQIKVGKQIAVEIYDEVIRGVLNIYPEEELAKRPFFDDGFRVGHISYKNLLDECDLILISWQMFFLTPENLKKQLGHINQLRKYKFSKKFFAKRKGAGDVTSKRIVDRLVRLQNYITENYSIPKNKFCGALIGKPHSECVDSFLDFFNINLDEFRSKASENALNYLIDKIQIKGINISRGVWKGGILPEVKSVNSVYKNTSGFVIKDDRIPFVFLPDEINPDEVMARRIYTLIYLLMCIGLNGYDFSIDSDFEASEPKVLGLEAKKHDLTAAILLPETETEKIKNSSVTSPLISQLALKYKITPRAVLFTLARRKIITWEERENLLPPPYQPRKVPSSPRKQPRVTTIVKKFCGSQAFNYINDGIGRGILQNIEAQYLIFGRVRKEQYGEYRSQIGL